jgi:hypothetical protein
MISLVQSLQADELSAEEIMAKSQTAMSQPLRYTLVSEVGGEMVVYQKVLPDGSIATLTNFPATKQITIAYGEKHYDIRLEHQIAIDTSGMMQSMRDQAASWAEDKTPKKSYETIGVIKHNDKDCYEILETISPEFVKAIGDNVPENLKNRIPAKSRFLIDKETYLVQEKETLTEGGATLSKVEYRDMQPQPDLSDDYFQLPPDLEVWTARSREEYHAIVADRLTPKRDTIAALEEIEAMVERKRKEFDAEIEQITMEAKERHEETKKMFEERLAEEIEKTDSLQRDREGYDHPLPEPSNRRIIFVTANGVIIVLILVLWFLRKKGII